MIFGFTENNKTIICGHTENKNRFETFKEEFSSKMDNAEEMDFLTQIKNYNIFGESLFVITHNNKEEQDNFVKENNILIKHKFDCEELQKTMVRKFEEIQTRDRNNKIREDAFKNGVIPKNTIGDLYFKDGIDPFDKRSDEKKEEDAQKLAERNEKILTDISLGMNKIPILTNLDKEDRDAQDMSHLRIEKMKKEMEDFDAEEDIVDPKELVAVMEYEAKYRSAKTDEDKQKLKEELNSKLSEKTIKAREEKEKEIADSRRSVEIEQFGKLLEDAKEKHKNDEHESNSALDRDIFIKVEDLSDKFKLLVGMVNKDIEEVKVVDLPLTSIFDQDKFTLVSEGVIFEKGKKSLVGFENVEKLSETNFEGMKSNLFKVIDKDKDVMVLYCDNTLDDDDKPKQIASIVRLSF